MTENNQRKETMVKEKEQNNDMIKIKITSSNDIINDRSFANAAIAGQEKAISV